MSDLTKKEKDLLIRLSKSPKCMHNPALVREFDRYWECGQCGLVAEKRVDMRWEVV